ncbi:bacteriocin leader domain-containing protein [Elizabethkingia meningoseptica]
MKTQLSKAKLLDKKGLKQIMGGYICPCGRPCPDPNQPPPKECD